MNLKFGVIGESDGNGHPYSWSIACNGYNRKNLNLIPYDRIRHYLQKYEIKYHKIEGVEVTHILTQNKSVSRKIAKVCNIKNICTNLNQLIKSVDAILLLRDDIQSRKKYLPLLLKSGKPILVDKFVHTNSNETIKLLKMQKFKGQIFAESSFRNTKKLRLNKDELKKLGKIKYISGITPNIWGTYGIHLVDSCLKFFNKKKIINISCIKNNDTTSLNINWSNNLISNFTSVKNSNTDIQLDLIGEKSHKRIIWDKDTILDDFTITIKKFAYMVKRKKFNINQKNYILISKILEKGLK